MHNCVSRIYGYVGHSHILLVTLFNRTKGAYLKKTKERKKENNLACVPLCKLADGDYGSLTR